MIGIENYCYIKFIGKEDNEIKHYWYVNTMIALKNGYPLTETIITNEKLNSIEGVEEYFEIDINGEKTFYKDINISGSFFDKKSLYKYYMPVDTLIKENKNFLFLIDAGDYSKLKDLIISEKIIDQIRKDKCKIVLNTSYEPYSNEKLDYVTELNNFVNKFNLSKDNLKIITGNLKVKNLSPNYEFIPYPYFLENPWFIDKDAIMSEKNYTNRINDIKIRSINDKKRYIEYNRNIKTFSKKILCYNRRAHTHRRYLFYNFFNDPLINKNIHISLNNEDQKGNKAYHLEFGCDDDKSKTINKFYEKNIKNFVFDGKDLHYNLAQDFNEEYHKNTFISVISETSVNKENIFFSEKTFKPIYACQPFILSANPGSLKKLKEFGFKSFDQWWDESYDDEILFSNRVEKMMSILQEICLKSDEELVAMLNDMETVLIHNFNTFIGYNTSNLIKIIDYLCPNDLKKLI